MANIFVSKPGKVAVLQVADSLPGRVLLQDEKGLGLVAASPESRRVIITRMNYLQAAHIQFQQTLSNAIYMYSFGDRMGRVQIGGISFSSICPNNSGAQSGVEDTLDYYAANRVSGSNKMVTVVIGSKPVKGFLLAASVANNSPEFMAYEWSFDIATVPPDLDAVKSSSAGSSAGRSRTSMEAATR